MLLEGFEGNVVLGDIMGSRQWNKYLPNEKGIYAIISPEDFIPEFTATGTGGYYKGKNPNIDISKLMDKWIDNTDILYFGKAGGNNQKTTLKSRISLYMLFGLGYPRPHYGGRYIWQLSNVSELHLTWRICKEREEPINLERELINQFKNKYSKLPFANLR